MCSAFSQCGAPAAERAAVAVRAQWTQTERGSLSDTAVSSKQLNSMRYHSALQTSVIYSASTQLALLCCCVCALLDECMCITYEHATSSLFICVLRSDVKVPCAHLKVCKLTSALSTPSMRMNLSSSQLSGQSTVHGMYDAKLRVLMVCKHKRKPASSHADER
jgi:hypothetical protein